MDVEQPAKRARKQSEKAENWASIMQFQGRAPYIRKAPYQKTAPSVPVSAPVPAPVHEPGRLHPSVVLSLYDKAPQLGLSEDQLTCYGFEVGLMLI
ncbi:hypothetical protein EON63_20905 [archaeon]|nr:MAG: hypothetical protein EON63_20905 [archaeon]